MVRQASSRFAYGGLLLLDFAAGAEIEKAMAAVM
jgi:hypothetical protein